MGRLAGRNDGSGFSSFVPEQRPFTSPWGLGVWTIADGLGPPASGLCSAEGTGVEFSLSLTRTGSSLMSTSLPRALLMVVVAAFIGVAAPCRAQPTPAPVATAPEPVSAPQPPKDKPSQKSNPSEESLWNAAGATAQCVDGTFFHGKINHQTCLGHGGVQKWLRTRQQALVR